MKNQKKIILTDDDPGIQDAVPLVFEQIGYSVTVFPNGDPLLKNAFEVPDLFILDKQLSGVDGLDICRFLKGQEATKHIPVIMLSANPNIGKLSNTAGADGFLEKPFKMKDLRALVASYLNDQT